LWLYKTRMRHILILYLHICSLLCGNEAKLRNERDGVQKTKSVKFDKNLEKFDDDVEV
jgi:hypothetical protein